MRITILLFLLINTFFLLGQNVLPNKQYTEIHINKLNSGYEEPNFENGILLNDAQEKKILNALRKPAGYRDETYNCFLPEMGFYFYNDADSAVLSALFSERCNAIAIVSGMYDTTFFGISDLAKGNIFDVVSETLWQLKPVLPEGTDTLFYEVGLEEDFDYVADTFHTSVEILCEINYVKPEWGLNEGRILWIYPNVKELKYPPIIRKQVEYVKIKDQTCILHIVQPKETLFSICKTYKVSQEHLVKYNKIKNMELQAGQKVLIPMN